MSSIKVGIYAQCIGLGGADGMFLNLMKHGQNMKCAFYATTQEPIELDWIHQFIPDLKIIYPAAKIHDDETDIVLAWNVSNIRKYVPRRIPVIEVSQNHCFAEIESCKSNENEQLFRVAVSDFARKSFAEHLPVTILHNGIDASRVAPRYGREHLRQQWGLGDKKVMLFLGRYVVEKHPVELVQVLKELPEDWVLLYCGHGPLFKNIKEAVVANGLEDRVRFVHFQYYVGDVLAVADAFVLQSDFEGFPLAILESWLSGTPVIVNHLGCMAGYEDYYYATDNQNIADVVQSAYNDEDSIILKAQALAWQKFTMAHMGLRWEMYIEECLHVHRQNQFQTTALGI